MNTDPFPFLAQTDAADVAAKNRAIIRECGRNAGEKPGFPGDKSGDETRN